MITNDQPSGTYIIDEEYNIVSYNDVALELYPQLKIGEKCYRCLMGLESPCPPCPVVNEIKGAQTYLDPIRKIYETVDAVPMYSEEKKEKRTALVFGTTGKRAEFSKQLPNTEKEFNSLYESEYYDKVTGGYSYQGFCRETEKILASSNVEEEYVIIYINVCNFKAINDMFGYEGGDALLNGIHKEIQKLSDSVKVFGRMSADRFVILVEKDKLNMYAISNCMNQKWHYNRKTITIYLQAGIYIIKDKTIPIESMIDRARLAKNSITENTVKSCAIFDEKMHRDYVDRVKVLSDFEAAIEKKEFKVFYQPVVSTNTGKIASAEALVRWIHPERGLIPPVRFIPTLEKSGMITRLDRYVANAVYEQLKAQNDANKKIVPVAINLSWIDLDDNDMKVSLREILLSQKIPKGYLCFEATETALNSMEKTCGEYLAFLRSEGSKILVDDFGSGYSSFNMIQKYDFDVIKIDKAFIDDIEMSYKTRNIISAIITMCHSLGVEVVAEGVETKEQYEFLQKEKCDYIQGYYIAKPMPEDEFMEYLNAVDA